MDSNGFVKDDQFIFLQMPASKYHKPNLAKEEQEVMDQLYRGWLHYWNHDSREDYHRGMPGARRFYDFDDMVSYDMFGNTNDGQMEYKDIEITALSEEYAYSTMIQHTWGTAGGVPFDTAFRRTGIARKNSEGQWKWIHEHLSFPTDIATKQADFTSSLDPLKATKLN
ncbi:hypothetical protein K4K56_012078 [Colletotrichum sp. SAR 10_98]|nr:hypothetical protein K4K56_012078 [Colletotrichum sp. SAR 10_98]